MPIIDLSKNRMGALSVVIDLAHPAVMKELFDEVYNNNEFCYSSELTPAVSLIAEISNSIKQGKLLDSQGNVKLFICSNIDDLISDRLNELEQYIRDLFIRLAVAGTSQEAYLLINHDDTVQHSETAAASANEICNRYIKEENTAFDRVFLIENRPLRDIREYQIAVVRLAHALSHDRPDPTLMQKIKGRGEAKLINAYLVEYDADKAEELTEKLERARKRLHGDYNQIVNVNQLSEQLNKMCTESKHFDAVRKVKADYIPIPSVCLRAGLFTKTVKLESLTELGMIVDAIHEKNIHDRLLKKAWDPDLAEEICLEALQGVPFSRMKEVTAALALQIEVQREGHYCSQPAMLQPCCKAKKLRKQIDRCLDNKYKDSLKYAQGVLYRQLADWLREYDERGSVYLQNKCKAQREYDEAYMALAAMGTAVDTPHFIKECAQQLETRQPINYLTAAEISKVMLISQPIAEVWEEKQYGELLQRGIDSNVYCYSDLGEQEFQVIQLQHFGAAELSDKIRIEQIFRLR
jgi:hypothetical protein